MKDQIPKHSSTWRTRWETMNGSLEDAEEGTIAWDRDLPRAGGLLIAVAGDRRSSALLIVLVWSRTHLVGIPVTGPRRHPAC